MRPMPSSPLLNIKLITPSFPSTARQTSFSDFHPGSYNPAWSVSNILVGLLSLWTSEEMTSECGVLPDSARPHATSTTLTPQLYPDPQPEE